MAEIEKTSPHRGIDFDDFLKEQGVFEEVMSSPKIKKAIRDLGNLIQAGEREAFAAGWNAFLATHSGLLMAHGNQRFPNRVRGSVGQILAEPKKVNERNLGNLKRLPKEPLGWGLSGIAIDGRSGKFTGLARINRTS